MDRQQEFVLRTLEERDIRFVRLWFTDVSGYLKAVAVAPAEIEAAFAEGIGFDGSAIEGFARVYESDMLAKPDPAIYAAVEREAGVPPETLLFADDRRDNIEAAAARGWGTHLFEDPEGLAARLVAEGLLTQGEAA